MGEAGDRRRTRRAMRAALRAQRRAVPSAERSRAARRVALRAAAFAGLRPGQRIALYAALPEELDTAPLIAIARARGCQVYLPRITRFGSGRMRFYRAQGAWRANRWGIPEPEPACPIGARWLDVVFVPLVAFDARGVRLGMGAGFYDRMLEFRRLRRTWRGPLLVGLAYAFQQLPEIEPAAHDVRLDAVITEGGVITCSTGS